MKYKPAFEEKRLVKHTDGLGFACWFVYSRSSALLLFDD